MGDGAGAAVVSRGLAAVAKIATKEAGVAQEKNSKTYTTKLAERKKEFELATKRAAKQERLDKARGGAGGGASGGRGGGKGGKGAAADLALEQQERLQRVLVATRMSSLVLLAQRDDNVEQVSRYEAAFKKMARAAGSNDAQVVITKFISRNETRAGLLEELGSPESWVNAIGLYEPMHPWRENPSGYDP